MKSLSWSGLSLSACSSVKWGGEGGQQLRRPLPPNSDWGWVPSLTLTGMSIPKDRRLRVFTPVSSLSSTVPGV